MEAVVEGIMNIVAIFATMNRSATAVACVRALAAQMRPPGRVVVADNRSTDSTVAELNGMGDLPFPLDVLEMPENAGNAGGVAAAMELAFANGADAVWILDDDSWPRPEALEALMEGGWDGKSVRHAHQIDPVTGKFSWPLQVGCPAGGWRLAWGMEELPDGVWAQSRIVWTGSLVSREIREAVGPVRAELFIRGEDEEYPLRIEQAGFPTFACRAALMDHPGPGRLAEWAFFGRRLFFECGLSDWKLYYKVRNMVWLKNRYRGGIHALAMATAYAAATARFDGVARIPLVVRAALDGWRGKLGKWRRHPA